MRPLVAVDHHGKLHQRVRAVTTGGGSWLQLVPLDGEGQPPVVFTVALPDWWRKRQRREGRAFGEKWPFTRIPGVYDSSGRAVYVSGLLPEPDGTLADTLEGSGMARTLPWGTP